MNSDLLFVAGLAGFLGLGVLVRIAWWWHYQRNAGPVDLAVARRCPECGLDIICNRCGWAVHRDLCPRSIR